MGETRELNLIDLGILLEDLEVIELESLIAQQEFHVPGAKRQDDENISKNKQMLERIHEGPSLLVLLQ